MALPICLREITPNAQAHTWSGAAVLRVGRLDRLEIALDDTSVSRRHAEIRPSEHGWQVIDCGSTNGTFLNGERLGTEPRHFRIRDIIQFGNIALMVEMSEEYWLKSNDLIAMLHFIQGNTSERKLRLFACACVYSGSEFFPISCFTGFWNEVLEVAYRMADNAVSQQEVANLVGRLHGLACSIANCGDNFYGQSAQTELLAQPFRLRDELELSSAIGINKLWWQPPPLLLETYATYLREMFGNPFHPVTLDPSWLTSSVIALAQGIYEDRAFDRMPILGDALMDADCDNEDILNHCRQSGEHIRGCWLLDSLLGRN